VGPPRGGLSPVDAAAVEAAVVAFLQSRTAPLPLSLWHEAAVRYASDLLREAVDAAVRAAGEAAARAAAAEGALSRVAASLTATARDAADAARGAVRTPSNSRDA
jgi:hypothetical protein